MKGTLGTCGRICDAVCVYVCVERRRVGTGEGHEFIKKAERITRMGERTGETMNPT